MAALDNSGDRFSSEVNLYSAANENMTEYLVSSSDAWEEHQLIFSAISMSGEKLTGPVMRRREPSGNFTYRAMTTDEALDFEGRDAW